MRRLLPYLRLDGFTLALVLTVSLASMLPATGAAVGWLDLLVEAAVMLLFFVHGARLSRDSILEALLNWRLQSLVLALTFVAFPALGWTLAPLAAGVLDPSLVTGLLFLCCLPATVQSAIAFTSIAGGNVPAAACAASASNILGVALTPLLNGLLLARRGETSFVDSIVPIFVLLLAPFLAGQLVRPLIGDWAQRRRRLLTVTDRSSILLMVYSAFSKAVVAGVWATVSTLDLALLIVACLVLLALVITLATIVARRLGFSAHDESTIVFCGGMKSLVTGLPMANVLFPGTTAGVLVLPLIVFHQLQLLVFAVLARHRAKRELTPRG